MGLRVEQHTHVAMATPQTGQTTKLVAVFNADGSPKIVPSQAAAQVDTVAMTQAAITGGESPTEAEFNALRVDLVNTRTTLNGLLAKLRTAGVIAP